MSSLAPLFQLYKSRLREFFRQPARIFWVYGFPLVLAVGLGLAFKSKPVEMIPVDLVESGSWNEVAKTIGTHNTKPGPSLDPRISIHSGTAEGTDNRLKTGKTPLVILAISPTQVEYRYDPTRPESVTARNAVDSILQRAAGRPDPVKTSDIVIDEPGSRYIDFLIPGLIGLNTMGGGLFGVGFLIVNFRVGKLLKRFMATPMPRRDFLLAIVGARLTFLVPDIAVLLSLGHFGFQMPIRGSLLLVVILDVIGALAFAGIGLLIAARANNTETVSGLVNLVMLPMWLFSGVFFSAERFPDAIQPFIQALPLTQLISGLRMVILEGAGPLQIWVPLTVLTVWSVVTFVVALKIFKWS